MSICWVRKSTFMKVVLRAQLAARLCVMQCYRQLLNEWFFFHTDPNVLCGWYFCQPLRWPGSSSGEPR
jgi:hypothetical protein